jgi:polar amino acid transport system substrate-binding protein
MKGKKRIAALVMAVAAMLVLVSCGSKSDVKIESLADLEGQAIAVQLGTVGDLYAEEITDASVDKFNKGSDAVQALKQGKVNAVIIDKQPAEEFASKNSDIKILDDIFEPEEYAIAIKKGNDTLTEEINTALEELRENGTLDQIYDNWIGENKGESPYETPDGTTYSNGTLVMATNAEFPPYEQREDGEIVGFDVDMMHAVCDVLGYELQVDDMAFDSIIAAVDSGKADVGVAGMTVTADRMENVNFSDSYTTAEQVLLVRSDSTAAKGSLLTRLKSTFIEQARWKYLTNGLKNTLMITFLAVIIGFILGFLLAIIRATHDKMGKLKLLNLFARVYLTVIRGTPVVVQLMILYFVVFVSVTSQYSVYVAVLAFGLNSAAYIAEIVRSGIMSIDNGQFEAGASLGFGYCRTMVYIILPQAFKNVLPALANEFIVLLKETSVAGYIAVQDLTKGGDIIRSTTYEAFLPLIAVAAIYLVMVLILTWLVSKLEAHLKRSER